MADQDAQDINKMMSATSDVAIKTPKKSIFLWIVLGCVVVGVGLGVVVYQQSIRPAPITKTSPKPIASVTKILPSPTEIVPSPLESPTVPQVSEVTPITAGVTFPKAGKLRVFYRSLISPIAIGVIIRDGSLATTKNFPSSDGVKTMEVSDTGYTLASPKTLKIDSFLGTDSTKLSTGWVSPVGGKCGFNGFGQVDISSYVAYATTQAGAEPIVSVQCWADYTNPLKGNGKPNPPELDFNDYLLIWTYTPGTGSSPSPSSVGSTAPSPSPSRSSSPSPSPSRSASPSPSPSRSPSPSPSSRASTSPSVAASIASSPSPRAAMPDTSEGTPVTGVFEVTVGTISVGLLLLVLGILGLLVL